MNSRISVSQKSAILSVEDVSVTLNHHKILDNIELSVSPFEKVLIVGQNGAGKSTLVKAVLGMVPIDSGRILFMSASVGTPQWRRRRREAGYVNQLAVDSDFPITVTEVVAIGGTLYSCSRKRREENIQWALERCRVKGIGKRLYQNLSGGEKQRVSLARCLVQNPSMLFLDEPTSSQDPDSAELFLDMLEELPLPILMVSHDERALRRNAWRKCELAEGRLV